MRLKFPKNFCWGASTSAHQVEGGNHNDWTEWEKGNAERLAREAEKKWDKQQQKKFPEMLKPENYISGAACDHYNRFREDFDIAKFLGHNAHRFSIEWSRVEPEEGRFDEKEIEHYCQVISALKERGIEPFVTLWHWTLPVWLRDKGGWLCKDAPKYFERYVEKVASKFTTSQVVNFWITLNEPEVFSSNAYLKDNWPPQRDNYFSYRKVVRNLVEAHKKSYKIIKEVNPKAQIGISKNNIYFEGRLSVMASYWWNYWFLKKIRKQQDFISLNYYFHNKIKGLRFNQNENKVLSDLGWEIYPEGIFHVLRGLKKYGRPIYVTENGLADAKDEKREKFIKDHLKWIHKAIQEGVDIRGYFHWSLLDNFEWDKGFWPRFGLVEVDYNTLERKIRPSAFEYAKICKNNLLDI